MALAYLAGGWGFWRHPDLHVVEENLLPPDCHPYRSGGCLTRRVGVCLHEKNKKKVHRQRLSRAANTVRHYPTASIRFAESLQPWLICPGRVGSR